MSEINMNSNNIVFNCSLYMHAISALFDYGISTKNSTISAYYDITENYIYLCTEINENFNFRK